MGETCGRILPVENLWKSNCAAFVLPATGESVKLQRTREGTGLPRKELSRKILRRYCRGLKQNVDLMKIDCTIEVGRNGETSIGR